jgi:regulator of protease activity HflC (stomatin/prohibitin superfamily)
MGWPQNEEERIVSVRIAAASAAGIGGLLGLSVLWGSWYTIDQGELGVVLRNGAVTQIADPGLHFKVPFIDGVVEMSTRNTKWTWEKMQTYSRDIQLADLRVSVNLRPDPGRVGEIYGAFGTKYVDSIVSPAVTRITKEIFGQYTAAQVVMNRARLGGEVEASVRAALANEGIIIESVQLENIDFSKAYEQAIEAAMQAEAEVKKTTQQLERQKVEAEKTVVDAKAKAEAAKAEADGRAYAIEAQARADALRIKLRGDAEAAAIDARGEALKKNATLVELIAAERWDGKLPQTMVPGSAVPFVGLK